MRLETVWTSEPMRIGKHDWRIGVALYSFPKLRLVDGKMKCVEPGGRQRCTFYEWRGPQSHVWNPATLWPTYDDHRGEDSGMPKTLRKLYDREADTVRRLLSEATTELTPAGEQLVIPGCERRPIDNGKPVQLGLFG